MPVSMRLLFSRRGISDQIVSLRHSLENHHNGLRLSLREADRAFHEYNRDSGFDCGCRQPDQIQFGISEGGAVVLGVAVGSVFGPLGGAIGGLLGSKTGGFGFDLAKVLPAWVPVDVRDHRETPRIIEGVLVKSRITKEDFPLKPWHTFYDWNFHVHVDPQYRYLLNEHTARHHSKNIFPERETLDIIECEWDTAFLPLRAIPQVGSRVWLLGRWIFDCGHPENGIHRMELHPVRAIASFGREAAVFEGNPGPVRANYAAFFVTHRGGYIDHPINTRDYAFDLYLPPRPHRKAEPRFSAARFLKRLGQPLLVEPRITFLPERNPKLARVGIPLNDVSAAQDDYDAMISVGWTDPDGTEIRKIKRYRVTVTRIRKIMALPPGSAGATIANMRWVFYIGVNGRWETMELREMNNDVNFAVEFDLHENDPIQVTACGFAVLNVHDFMGMDSGVSPELISLRNTLDQAQSAAERVVDTFKKHLSAGKIPTSFSNIGLSLFSKIHSPVRFQPFEETSEHNPAPGTENSRENGYVLEYKIEEVVAPRPSP